MSAFNWFLGDNDLQLPLYDSVTGVAAMACIPTAPMRIRSESTLSFLMALRECARPAIPTVHLKSIHLKG